MSTTTPSDLRDTPEATETVTADEDRASFERDVEIRLALVMNGGVSLAVWMGGVTTEIDHLRCGDGVYGELLEFIQSTVRVDVIAGASAGGLNGALLGTALARGGRVDGARSLWLRDGSLLALLRDPLSKDPPSLFDGDGFFRKRLQQAFRDVAQAGGSDAAEHPVALVITGTILAGEARGFADDFGSVIVDCDHRARFRFRHKPATADQTEHPAASFDGDQAFAQLALAARTSSSFPGAFEPSYCPIGADETEDRPDMAGCADFSASRWAVDGGVLVNTPFRDALAEIYALPADGEVRRVVAYVVPSPSALTKETADDPTATPRLLSIAMDSLSTLPRSQSIGRELEEIAAYNVRVRSRQRSREQLLANLDEAALAATADTLYQAHADIRKRTSIDEILALAADSTRRDGGPRREALVPENGSGSAGTTWPREELRRALEETTLPWIPSDARALKRPLDGGWRWGIEPLRRGVDTALDLVRRALRALPPTSRSNEATNTARHSLSGCLNDLHEQREAVAELTAASKAFWRGVKPPAAAGHDELRECARQALVDWEQALREAGGARTGSDGREPGGGMRLKIDAEGGNDRLEIIAAGVAAALGSARVAFDRARTSDGFNAPDADALALVDSMFATLVPNPAEASATVAQLLRLQVVQGSRGGSDDDVEQPIELIQISGDTPNALDGRLNARDKLAGLQLAHFGAFYKESWRANDWMWGRLDGSMRLVQLVLKPERLRRLGLNADDALKRIREIATQTSEPESTDLLVAKFPTRAICRELEFLDKPEMPLPLVLPRAVQAIARRIQLDAIREELPQVARSVEADLDAGGSRIVPARSWARRISPQSKITAAEAIDCFRENQIGRERIMDEIGSDLFTHVATKAGLVAASAARSRESGLGPLRGGATAVRGVMLAVYFLARGVVGRSRAGAFLVGATLALGAALLALSIVLDRQPSPILTSIGVAIVLGGVVLAVLRSGFAAVAAIVVLGGLVALGAQLLGWFDDQPSDWPSWARIAFLAVTVGLASLLGLLRRPDWVARNRQRRAVRRAVNIVRRSQANDIPKLRRLLKAISEVPAGQLSPELEARLAQRRDDADRRITELLAVRTAERADAPDQPAASRGGWLAVKRHAVACRRIERLDRRLDALLTSEDQATVQPRERAPS
jgi:patatin-related protein